MPIFLESIFNRNLEWVRQMTRENPSYFSELASEHAPKILFIGCSDARVPAELVTQTQPGELFVHRNIANLVVQTDINLQAVLQFAVDVIGVREIVVCGHYGCNGVKASLDHQPQLPLLDQWLANIRSVSRLHADELAAITDPDARRGRLVELNVMEQVYNLSKTVVVQEAWSKGRPLRLHGWVYALQDGLLRDLGVTLDRPAPEWPSAMDARPVTLAESALHAEG